MKAGIVQKIFKDHYARYESGRRLSLRERRAAYKMMTCRTPAQGYHVEECPDGHYKTIQYNSCKHRSCPQCGVLETELWIRAKQRLALNCPYFHCVFTIPSELHILWMYNRASFVNLYFLAAWHTLRDFFKDSKWLGATPGVIGAFQSWGETLHDHLHLHFIVTGGGLREDGSWLSTRESFLLPSRAVADKFRGKFRAYLSEAFKTPMPHGTRKSNSNVLKPPSGRTVQECNSLLNKAGRKKWHVQIEPPYDYVDGVVKYLARYMCRGSLSERRVRAYDGQIVRIAYKKSDDEHKGTFDLSAKDFIRRILMHVPPKGLHMVRNFGLFHPSYRKRWEQARRILGQSTVSTTTSARQQRMKLRHEMFPRWKEILCPVCGQPLITTSVCYRGNSPPLRKVA